MEIHSHTDQNDQVLYALESQLRDCYGRVVYSHKTHEKCADLLLSRLNSLKVLQIIISVLISAGFIGTVFDPGRTAVVGGLLLSVASLVINAYLKSFDFVEIAQKHKQSATNLWLIREKYLSLLVDISAGNESIDNLKSSRNAILEQLHNIYAGAPSTNYTAYRKAQKSLKRLEDLSFGEEELDRLLPTALRRSSQTPGAIGL